jgi:hypothetical protein
MTLTELEEKVILLERRITQLERLLQQIIGD